MPRPLPWLCRLNRIRTTVANSQRSHYSRRELELLFGVSERSAGRLLELLATEPIGTSHVVNREVLASFLERVGEAEDVPALCEQIRSERENLTRVKARYLMCRDVAPLPLTSLPSSIVLEPGELRVSYRSLEDLCAQLMQLSLAMESDPVGFEARCDPPRERSAEEEFWQRENQETAAFMAAELRRRASAKKPPAEAGGTGVANGELDAAAA